MDMTVFTESFRGRAAIVMLASAAVLASSSGVFGQSQTAPAAHVPDARAAAITSAALESYKQNHDETSARTALAKARQIDPAYPDPLFYLARIEEEQENWSAALDDYQALLKLDDHSILFAKAQARIEDVRRLAEIDKTPEGKRNRKFEGAMAVAVTAFTGGRPNDAAKAAQEAAVIDPQRWEAPALQGRIFLQLSQDKIAEDYLNKALALAPDDKKSAVQALLAKVPRAQVAPASDTGTADEVRNLLIAAQSAVNAKAFDIAAQKTEQAGKLARRDDLLLSAAIFYTTAQCDARAAGMLRGLSNSSDQAVALKAATEFKALEPVLAASSQAFLVAKRLADQDDPAAEYEVGLDFAMGRGVDPSDAEAFAYFSKASAKGDPAADFDLGVMYSAGRGTARNLARAVECFRSAATAGIAEAQFALGCALEDGAGAAKDHAAAIQWINSAAGQGLQDARDWLDRHKPA